MEIPRGCIGLVTEGGRWGGGRMQALSFLFWVLQTAVKIICVELMDTVPVQMGRCTRFY